MFAAAAQAEARIAARPGGPALVLCALTALLPLVFAIPPLEPFREPKELLLTAGATAMAAIWMVARRNSGLPRTWMWAPVTVLAASMAVAALRHPAPGATAATAHFLALLVLLVAAASWMREPGARAALATAITLAGVVEAVYVLWQSMAGDPWFSTAGLAGKWRGFGTFGNPNWAGEFLAVCSLVAWGRWTARRESKEPGQAAALACVLLIAMGLAATFSRGAWLACAVGVFCFSHMRRVRLREALAPVGVFVVTAVALFVTRPDTQPFLANAGSLRGRVWMWIVSARMIRDAPWGGFGPGEFAMVFPRYQAEAFLQAWAAPFLSNGSFTPYAHNDFLQLWSEAGAAAAVALGVLACVALRRGRAVAGDPVALGMWAGLVALVVEAGYGSPLYLPASGALAAVLLGAVETAACTRTCSLPAAVRVRAVAFAIAVLLCAAAGTWCWRRAVGGVALGRAAGALNRGGHRAADRALRTAIRYAPDRMETWSLAGRLRFERADYAGAAAAFDRAVRLGYDADVFEARAGALWKCGRHTEAVAVLEELVRLRPDLKWGARELRILRGALEH